MKKLLLLLIFAAKLSIGFSQTTILSQDFSSSALVTNYVNASTPTSSQFNAISTSGAGVVVDINSGRLRYARTTTNVGSFSRTTDFSPTPDVIVYKFDLQVSGNNAATTSVAVFQIGSGFGTANSAESNASVHSRFGINFTANPGEFTLRDVGTGTNSTTFTGLQTITWVVNNSSGTYSYTPPVGTGTETLASDKWDLFIGNTKVLDERDAQTATQTLTDLKFAFTAGVGTIEIDNILIQSIDVIPPTFTSLYPKVDNIAATSYDLISNLNEIGTTYYVVLPDGATQPTSAQVAAGNNASDVAAAFSGSFANTTANADYIKSVTGLTTNTAYDVYLVAKDAANNLQSSTVKLDVTSTGTLPIQLTTFTGKAINQSILLNWNTASETNNNYYDMLRSADRKSFTSIGTIKGAGNSTTSKDYLFNDENPFAGTNYYQLVQHDFDGKTASSAIIPVDSKIDAATLSVYANVSSVKISLSSPNKTKGLLQVFDIAGRKLSESSVEVNKGFNSFDLPLTLINGVHFARYISGTETINQKFIK